MKKIKKSLIKAFMALNRFIIRASRGKLGTQLAAQRILLLHSTGHRTGKHYLTPISFFQMDSIYFVVGSNWGEEQNANWYYNLLAHPRTIIEVRGKSIQVLARVAHDEEYSQLWDYAVSKYSRYRKYKEMTMRRIPIVVLQPIGT